MVVIPADSVHPEKLAVTISLIQCVREIGGGMPEPATAGWTELLFSVAIARMATRERVRPLRSAVPPVSAPATRTPRC